jgi:zinc protease
MTGLLGIERVELSNGARAFVAQRCRTGPDHRACPFRRSYAAIDPKDAVYAQLGDIALMDCGFGTLGREDLDRLATGRKLSLDFDIGDTTFGFSADTRPADLDDQLYLFAAKLASPRWDEHRAARAGRVEVAVREHQFGADESPAARPAVVAARRRSRFATPNPAELSKATPKGSGGYGKPCCGRGRSKSTSSAISTATRRSRRSIARSVPSARAIRFRR